MADHYVSFSIPFFLLFFAIEAIYFRYRNQHKYRINDTISNLSCGTVTLIFELFTKGFLFVIFDTVVANFSIMQWSLQDASTWIVFFFVYDFFYYWGHRLSHTINLWWGGHLPHHQSEEYNLTVALRQGAFQDTLNFPVFIPMAIMGCPIEVFASTILLNKFFQFWIHSRAIGRVPLIEGIFNTPSAHRVHHSVNPIYVDKNHGGFLMIWDKVFGTWSEERASEPCIYGVRKPYRSWNPIAAHVDWWSRLWTDACNTKRWSDKLKIWFMPTGWRPDDVQKSDPWDKYDIDRYQKYDSKVSGYKNLITILLFLLTIPAISYLIDEQFNLPFAEKAGLSLLVLVCLYLCGRLQTSRDTAQADEDHFAEPRQPH